MEISLDLILKLLPYYSLIVILIAISFLSKIYKYEIFSLFIVFLLIIFSGFKEIISPDFERYAYAFENIDSLGPDSFEPFFIILSKALKELGFNYYALFFLYSFLTIFLIYLSIKKLTPHINYSIFIYICIPGFFLNTFVEMRQSLAVALFFYGVTLNIRDEHKLKSLLIFIFAILTHYSAFLPIVLYILVRKGLKKIFSFRIYTFLLIATLIFAFFRIDIIFLMVINKMTSCLSDNFFYIKYIEYLNYYIEGNTEQVSGQIYKNAFFNFILLFIIFNTLRNTQVQIYIMQRDYIAQNVMINLMFLGVMLLNITFNFAVLSRIAYYFLVFIIVLLPNSILYIKDKMLKILYLYVASLMFLAIFMRGLLYFSEEVQQYIFLLYRNILWDFITGNLH